MKSVQIKTKTRRIVTALAISASFGTPAFAKKQFNVDAEQDAYRQSCKINGTTSLLKALQNETEANEFLRLWAETSTSRYSSYNERNSAIFCNVIVVPSNEVLKGITITEANRDAVAILLNSHILGASILEESDFSVDAPQLRSWSGNLLKLSRSESGVKTVNGVPVTGGSLSDKGHSVLVVANILPEVQESIASAIEAWPEIVGFNFDGYFAPKMYPVLSNLTGKPYVSFNEISKICGFDQDLASGNVTVLLPTEIVHAKTPVLKDLFASDKEFVCRAFRSNILKGRFTSEDLRKKSTTADNSVTSIDGRVFTMSSFDQGIFAQFQIGDLVQAVAYTAGRNGTGYTVDERDTAGYVIFEAIDFVEQK